MRSSRSSSNASAISTHSTIDLEPTQQIFVKLLSGETISLTIPPSTPITTLLHLLSLRTSLPPASLRLLYTGHHLPPSPTSNVTLSTLSIPPSALLELTLPIRGGMTNKKIRCNAKECKEVAQRIVGDCGFCEGHFCGKHRMLEDHKCVGLENCKKESRQQNADKLNSEATMVSKIVQ